MKNLLVRTKFYWSWGGGQLLFVSIAYHPLRDPYKNTTYCTVTPF